MDKSWLKDTNRELTKDDVIKVRNELKPLDLKVKPNNSEIEIKYFKYYEIDFPVDLHYFGFYPSLDKKIAAHIYQNKGSKGTVILLHGYLEHSAVTFVKLIPELLDHGFVVVTIDLPGHGFSDGKRADSRNFNEYVWALKDFYSGYDNQLPRPFHLLGHSTGCIAIFEALYDGKLKFQRYILTAPLIRSSFWGLSKIGMSLFGWLIPKVPGLTKRGTSNHIYSRFISKRDPLFIKWAPTSWVLSLYRWEKQIRKYEINKKKVVILQGKRDRALQWKKNMIFLGRKFPNSIIRYFPDANHTLYTEPEIVRQEVIQATIEYLQ
jgi:alpha-beta hydrolase superfamily lysophospholipase